MSRTMTGPGNGPKSKTLARPSRTTKQHGLCDVRSFQKRAKQERSRLTTSVETYEHKIPSCLPNGEYLLRIQSLGIHNPWPAGVPQFYISCAQINVTGSSAPAGSFAPTLSIPGVFKETDSGYTANVNLPGLYPTKYRSNC